MITYGFDGDRAGTDFNRVDTTRNLTQGTETIVRAGGFNFADAVTIRADAYIQNEIGLFEDRLKLIPGVRLAHTDVQFKVGAIFDVTETLSVYGQFSEGFKMPTAQQLFQSVDSLPFFALVPNPNLMRFQHGCRFPISRHPAARLRSFRKAA